MADRVPPSRRSFLPPPGDPGEDFLFHLYRGNEMLQDNRVHDAKAEIEQALALQPSDPKGQDLLGVVYFRLGLYPRAIAIYERLIQDFPEAVEPRINLSLCYLKTGQPVRARAELEKAVGYAPNHTRAWGYLGLAHQALGDIDRAIHAFTVGGHDAMAKRLMDATAGAPPQTARRPSLRPGSFQEIDRSADLAPSSAIPQSVTAALEALEASNNAAASKPGDVVPPLPPKVPLIDAEPKVSGMAPMSTPLSAAGPSLEFATRMPLVAAELAKRHMIVFPRDHKIAQHAPTGLVLVQAQSGFSVRLNLVRAMSFTAGFAGKVVSRRQRGKTLSEPLGGADAPIVELEGKGELVLGAGEGHRLVPITLDEDPIYLREDALGGFEPQMGYENGRMPAGDGEAVPMVQVRGPGSLVSLLPKGFGALEVTEGRSLALASAGVLGWTGRVIPRALAASEAPPGAKGFVVFAGEGTVMMDGR